MCLWFWSGVLFGAVAGYAAATLLDALYDPKPLSGAEYYEKRIIMPMPNGNENNTVTTTTAWPADTTKYFYGGTYAP